MFTSFCDTQVFPFFTITLQFTHTQRTFQTNLHFYVSKGTNVDTFQWKVFTVHPPGFPIFLIVSYLTPVLVGSYAPVTDHSKTAPYVRYISSGLYIKILALENFSMCLWTPYKDALWCLEFDRGRVCNFKKLEPLWKSDNWQSCESD